MEGTEGTADVDEVEEVKPQLPARSFLQFSSYRDNAQCYYCQKVFLTKYAYYLSLSYIRVFP